MGSGIERASFEHESWRRAICADNTHVGETAASAAPGTACPQIAPPMEARRIATVAAIPFAPAESAYADKGSNRPTPEARER